MALMVTTKAGACTTASHLQPMRPWNRTEPAQARDAQQRGAIPSPGLDLPIRFTAVVQSQESL